MALIINQRLPSSNIDNVWRRSLAGYIGIRNRVWLPFDEMTIFAKEEDPLLNKRLKNIRTNVKLKSYQRKLKYQRQVYFSAQLK